MNFLKIATWLKLSAPLSSTVMWQMREIVIRSWEITHEPGPGHVTPISGKKNRGRASNNLWHPSDESENAEWPKFHTGDWISFRHTATAISLSDLSWDIITLYRHINLDCLIGAANRHTGHWTYNIQISVGLLPEFWQANPDII